MRGNCRFRETSGGGHARRRFAVLTCALVLMPFAPPCAAAAPGEDAVASDTADVGLPQTIQRVWAKVSRKIDGLPGGRNLGDLTLSPESIDFAGNTERKSFSVPLEAIRTVSFGLMKGDVDTDWVILDVRIGDESTLLGLRDGRHMGFGGRTTELYEAVLALMRRGRAAQYDVPSGFSTYDELDRYFTVAYPQGCSAVHRSVIQTPDQILGVLEFSPGPGESSVIRIERDDAGAGMRPKGFTNKARAKLLDLARATDLLDAGYEMLEPPLAEPATIDARPAWRIVIRARQPGGWEVLIDQRFVVDGSTLYDLALRCIPSEREAATATFDTMVDSFRFSVALPMVASELPHYGMD